MATKKELESKLSLKQREAALKLVENELSETEERRTQEEISEELGITRMCLYKWRTQNRVFIEYKNMLADEFFSEKRAFVYRQLFKLIGGSQPSVKAIDLYMRRHGLLTDKQVIEDATTNGARTNEQLEKEIAELDDLLK
ncbi:TPA: phBC6A51 family helix-turn-helix protein [Bacillus cereus]|uniref:phBC6A51 family helix-turn-helix protein n=1 Tax=unclassified Bacillus cereus group TaxID=2750818 RepID=UPI00391E7AD6